MAGRSPAIKIAPRPGPAPSELRYRGGCVGTIEKRGSGGVMYRAGWQMDAFADPPPFRQQEIPAPLRRDHGPFRCESRLVERLERLLAKRAAQ